MIHRTIINNKQVIGVVKDFHYRSLYYEIEPIIIELSPLKIIGEVGIRISPYNVPKTIKHIENTWNDFNKGKEAPFKFLFIDEKINMIYRRIQNFGKTITYCTLFAIFVRHALAY